MVTNIITSVFIIVLSVDSAFSQSGSECRTPYGEIAQCVSVFRCPTVLRILDKRKDPNINNFLQQLYCGNIGQEVLVCCGSRSPIDQGGTQIGNVISQNPQQTIKLLPPRGECGLNGMGDRILGGNRTELDEFPWLALLEYRNQIGRTVHSCGGALINNRYVLTAAHCVTGQITTQVGTLFRVRLGEYNVNTNPDCTNHNGYRDCSDPHQDIRVEEAVPHPGYDVRDVKSYNDIALIRLSRPVQYTDFIKPICLPLNKERSRERHRMFVAGWGKTERSDYSPIKLKVDVPVVSNQNCDRIFKRFNVKIRDSQICAGGDVGKDSCQGDSGGPLVRFFDKSMDWFVEGIVSFGTQCGTRNVPGVYTRVSEYIEWILQTIRP